MLLARRFSHDKKQFDVGTDVNLAGILGDAGADPEGLMGGRGCVCGESTPYHRGRGLKKIEFFTGNGVLC